MNLSYYKIRIKQNFFRIQFHLKRTDKKGKFLMLSFIFLEILNFILFNYDEFINFLETNEKYFAKSYVSLPIAIIVTWLIAYIYHKKINQCKIFGILKDNKQLMM